MLDKLITVYLTAEDVRKDFPNEPAISPAIKTTLKEFQEAVKRGTPLIATTQTNAISVFYYEKGYDIEVVSNGERITFSQLLGDTQGENSFGREIRRTQNWEKMLHAGCFNIKSNWEFDE